MTGIVLAFLAGIAVRPVLKAATYFAVWSLTRTTGTGECLVCDHCRVTEIGQHRNIIVSLYRLQHRVFWSYRRWHREAWAVHQFNPRRVAQ